jgi:hypothetical protein
VLAKMAIRAIPSDCITAVQTLKQNSTVLAKIEALKNLDLSSESTPAMIGSDGTALQKCWDCARAV